MTPNDLLPFIDFTLLDDTFSQSKLDDFIKQAKKLKVASICVYPQNIDVIQHACVQTKLTTVINFPSGNESLADIQHQVEHSTLADELDVVFPYQTYLNESPQSAFEQMAKIIELLPSDKIIKVIIESGLYTSEQDIKDICQFLINQPIHFIKTSTGKTPIGATLEAAKIILETIKNTNKGIKISGGVRTFKQAISYYDLAKETFKNNLSAKNFRLGVSKLPN